MVIRAQCSSAVSPDRARVVLISLGHLSPHNLAGVWGLSYLSKVLCPRSWRTIWLKGRRLSLKVMWSITKFTKDTGRVKWRENQSDSQNTHSRKRNEKSTPREEGLRERFSEPRWQSCNHCCLKVLGWVLLLLWSSELLKGCCSTLGEHYNRL